MRRLLSLAVLLFSAFPAVAAPKNVVLLIADDLGMQVGCYGDKAAKTPHIDALAAAGTRFTHGFASVASCSPSRATILTGLPTHQCGQYGLAHATHNVHSFRKVKSLPALLAPAGYRTGVIAQAARAAERGLPVRRGDRRRTAATSRSSPRRPRTFSSERGDKPFFLLVGFTDPHRAAKGFGNERSCPPHARP